MIHCPRCQSELPQDARFCNRCGFNQTDANIASVLERIQQASPAAPGMPSPQRSGPAGPAQQFGLGNLPTTPVPGKEMKNGPYDTVQVAPPDTPPARRLSLRERYLAEQGASTQAVVPSPPPPQPSQPAAGTEGQGRTRLSHFMSPSGVSNVNNAPAPQQPQGQPGNNDEQGWIEPEQRYRQNQVIRTSTPRPPMHAKQSQPIVRVSTPPPARPPGPGAPMAPPRGAVQPPPQPQPQSYSLDTLLQQDAILSEASRYALQRWRQGWWQRQHDEAAPAVGVSRGQAHVPEPLMRMQHSIARMRAIIVPKNKR